MDFISDTLPSPTMQYNTPGIDLPNDTFAAEEMQQQHSDNFGVTVLRQQSRNTIKCNIFFIGIFFSLNLNFILLNNPVLTSGTGWMLSNILSIQVIYTLYDQ